MYGGYDKVKVIFEFIRVGAVVDGIEGGRVFIRNSRIKSRLSGYSQDFY